MPFLLKYNCKTKFVAIKWDILCMQISHLDIIIPVLSLNYKCLLSVLLLWLYLAMVSIIIQWTFVGFLCPGLKGPPGASSSWIVRPFVCLSVCPSVSVCNSVPLTNKVYYLKFGWWYSNQTWSVTSSIGSSHFADIICPWGWAGSKCRT